MTILCAMHDVAYLSVGLNVRIKPIGPIWAYVNITILR